MVRSGTASGIILALLLSCTHAAAARDLTVVGWGGAAQRVQDEIFFQPFSKETGIPITQDSWQGGYGVIKAKVEAGDANWDVVHVEADEMKLGCADGILEKLDWQKIGNRGDFIPGTTSDCGVGNVVWAFVLAYDGDRLHDGPKSWPDFWDTAKYPGKRGIRKSAKGALEIALLADGVPAGELYEVLGTPAGVDRAFAKLGKLKDRIVWWESSAQVIQLIGSGEIDMAAAYHGSLDLFAKNEKRNFKFVWTNSLYGTDYWVILKGTPFRQQAMDLVAYMSQTDRMAEFPRRMPYGVPNKKAMALLPPEISGELLTSDQNFKDAIELDAEFWLDNGEELSKRFNAWLAQ